MKKIEDLAKLLEGLVKTEEDQTIEFKENNYSPEHLGERISGLANTACLEGKKLAYLVYGVNDKSRAIVGTKRLFSAEKKGNFSLEHWLRRALKPECNFKFYEFKYDDKDIVLFEIPPAVDKPVEFQGIAYIRISSETTSLKKYPQKEREIWNNIYNKSFEMNIAKDNVATKDVLDLLDYDAFFRLTKEPVPSDTQDFVNKMEQWKLVTKVVNGLYDIRNLGAIAFARDLTMFDSLKRKPVRVMTYEADTRVKRRSEKLFASGYAKSFEDLISYINSQLPGNEVINTALRTEEKMYPEVAIREFVANAIIHQDLSISGSGVIIEIFSNRVEITNPGVPLIPVDRFIDHPPRSRNENLAGLMRLVGICEEGGTGIDRALTQISLFQLPAPKFEIYQNAATRVTLYAYKKLKDMTNEDKIRACYQHAVLLNVQNKNMTNESLRERLGISKSNYPAASQIISDTKKTGLIKDAARKNEYVPIWA